MGPPRTQSLSFHLSVIWIMNFLIAFVTGYSAIACHVASDVSLYFWYGCFNEKFLSNKKINK